MATTVSLNGTSYSIPSASERNWASLSTYLIALSTGVLTKAGGSFTLTAEADFGATYGLKSAYYKSKGTNIAAAGVARLANAESVSWRNAANSADKALKVNSSDRLEFDSVNVPTISSTDTLTNKTLTSPVINTPTGITKSDVGLGNVDNTSDATKNAATATLTNKTLSGNTATNLISGSGTLTLNTTGTITVPNATDTLVGKATTDTLTNKTLTSPVINTPTGIVKGDVGLGNVDNTSDATKDAATATLTNKTLTSPNINTQATIKAGGELRLNNAGDTFYTGFKSGNATANKIWVLPLADGSSGNALTTDGAGNLSFSAVATDALNQYNVKIGNSGNTATAVNTNLLGTIAATYSSATVTITNATPAVVTYTSHGLSTGDRIYFTTDGALPTGVSASTMYVITKVDANTFKLSTTIANCVAGTFVATSSAGSGTHTGYIGGFKEKSGYQGNYDGTPVPSGYIGEVVEGTAMAGTGGNAYGTSISSSSSWTASTRYTLFTKTLNKGSYLLVVNHSAVGWNSGNSYDLGLKIGGTAVMPSYYYSSPNVTGGCADISLTLPINITADSTIVIVDGRFTGAGGPFTITTYGYASIIRIA